MMWLNSLDLTSYSIYLLIFSG